MKISQGICLSILLWTIAPISLAEGTTELSSLDVVASRLDENVYIKPGNITIISSEDIEKSPGKSLPEIISREAGINSRSLFGANTGGTIDIRGFGATATQNTLILIDGRRQNDIDLSEINFPAIPLHNIDRIEIMRGSSGGILYGDGATGGVINIITKRAPINVINAEAKLGYGSYHTSQAEAAFAYGTDSSAVNIAANILDSDNYRNNNKILQKNIQSDLRKYTGSSEIYLKVAASDQELELPGVRTVDLGTGLDEIRDNPRGSRTINDFGNEDNFNTVLGITYRFSNTSSVTVDGGYRNRYQEAFFDDYDFGGLFSEFVETEIDVYSITPRFNITSQLLGHSHHLIGGFDFYHYQYDSIRSQNKSVADRPKNILDHYQNSYAIYFNDLINLNKSTIMDIGMRLQHVKLQAKDAFDPTAPGAFGNEAEELNRKDTEPMFNLGLRHYLNDGVSIFALGGRSVRFTTVDEIFQVNPATFLQEFSIIDPQTASHIDIGINYNSQKLSGALTVYYMDLKNEIFFDATTFANINLDPTERYGIELSSLFQIREDLKVIANYSHLRSRFSKGPFSGNDVPLVPRNTATVTSTWNLFENLAILSATWSYVGEMFFANDPINTFIKKIPDYNLLDLSLTGSWYNWSYSIAVNNITDEKYYNFGVNSNTAPRYNGYPQPGRNLFISLKYLFN